jgi:WD40 repeat protein
MKLSLFRTLTGHNSSIYKIIVGKTNNDFFSLAGDGFLVKWNINQSDGILVAQSDDKFFSGTLVTNELLVAGAFSGQLYWFDLKENIIEKRVLHHKKAIFGCLVVSGNLYTISQDGALVRWNIETMTPELTFIVSAYGLRSIENFDDNTLIVGSMDGYLYCVDKFTFQITKRWKSHENSVFAIKVFENVIYTIGRDAMLKKWSMTDNTLIQEIPAHWYTINDIVIFENFILTASRDKKIRVWDNNFILLQSIDVQQGGHLNSVNSISVMTDSKKLISCSDDRTIKVWDILS